MEANPTRAAPRSRLWRPPAARGRSVRCVASRLFGDRRIRIVPLERKRPTEILQHAEVLLEPAVEDHPHRPRPGEDFRILDGGFVVDVVAVPERVPFDDV